MHSTRLVAFASFVTLLTACKFQQGASDVKVYEQEQYLDQNICELMKNEALEKAKAEDVDPITAYAEIVKRESEIFDQLVPKATQCIEQKAELDRKAAEEAAKQQQEAQQQQQASNGGQQGGAQTSDGSQQQVADATQQGGDSQQGFDQTQQQGLDQTQVAQADPSFQQGGSDDTFDQGQGFENGLALQDGFASGGASGQGVQNAGVIGPECEGLDQARLDVYKRKVTDIASCRELKPEDVPEDLRRGKSATCRDATANLPSWVDETCNVSETSLASMGKAGIGAGCDMIATLLKSQKAGKYDTPGSIECGAEIVKQMCGEYAKAGIDGIVLADNESVENKNAAGAAVFGKAQMKIFVNSVAGCVKAYGAAAVKEAVTDGIVQGAGRTAFRSAIDSAEDGLKKLDKQKLVKAIAAAACKISTDLVAAKLEQTPKKVYQDSCSAEALSYDKQQAAACMRTTGDACEIVLSGKIDLAAVAGLSDDEVSKAIADVASAGVEALCAAGGKVSSVACGTISKSTQYIKDAILEGKSNPWADCLGTTKAGACVGQKLWEWSNGVNVSDFQQSQPGLQKPSEEAQYYEMDICWCAVTCWENVPWGYDKKIEGTTANRWYAENNTNLCRAKSRTNYLEGSPAKYNGHEVYEVISGCENIKARSKNRYFNSNEQTGDVSFEVYTGGSWQNAFFPGAFCQGKTSIR